MVQKYEQPKDLQEMRERIALRHVDFPRKAGKVLRFALEHPGYRLQHDKPSGPAMPRIECDRAALAGNLRVQYFP